MSKLKRKYLRASIAAVAITVVLLLTLTATPAMAQWTPDSDIASGLEGIGKNSAPAVFSHAVKIGLDFFSISKPPPYPPLSLV